MKRGTTKCEWCLAENSNDSTECATCGGPVSVLEPWILQCGWCKTSNRRDQVSHCINCGGQLPSIPGSSRQPEPPKALRRITSSYKRKVKYTRNAMMIVGIGFTCLGIPMFIIFLFISLSESFIFSIASFFILIFPAIGLWAIFTSGKKANQKLYALEYGVPTRGVIQRVYADTTRSINDKHPLKIEYEFDTPSKTFLDAVRVWDRTNLKRPSGEHIWVVFNPKDLKENNLWPPLA